MKKLNIGCGSKILEGYCNADIRPLDGVDWVVDIENPPYAMGNSEFGFIFANNVLEHIALEKTGAVLDEWNRILIQGGELEIMVPNMVLNFEMWLTEEHTLIREGQTQTERFSEVVFGLQDYGENYHKQLFDEERLRDVLRKSGFGMVRQWKRGRGLCILGKKK